MANKLNIHTFIGSICGVGFLPKMPGTFGTMVAALVYYLIPAGLTSGGASTWYFGIGLVLFILFAVWNSTQAEKTLGHDAPAIVIDELCGYFVAVLFLPKTLIVLIYAFIFFRAFDILKTPPINQLQRLPRGWGIVADDVLAGVYANIIMQAMLRIYPNFF